MHFRERKRPLQRQLAIISFMSLILLCGIILWVNQSEETVPVLTLTEEMSMPIPNKAGRGEPMEDLVPMYAEEFADDPVLKEAVLQFRRWDWPAMYRNLDDIVDENPEYLDAYRLQAEAYMINKNYKAALAQLDRVLERDPRDVHALGVTTVLMRILGDEAGEAERMDALEMVCADAAKDIRGLLEKTELLLSASYGDEPQTDLIPDVIAVFGQTPKANGKPSSGLLSRLEKALEMAERFPDAKLILSGGDVKTEFTEAAVMKEWLLEQGIEETRLLLDEDARDTYGNAIGIISLCEEINAHKVLVVGTMLHLPRAVTTLSLHAEHVGYALEVDWAGGGETNAANEEERLYTYVNAARAAGLFAHADYSHYQ